MTSIRVTRELNILNFLRLHAELKQGKRKLVGAMWGRIFPIEYGRLAKIKEGDGVVRIFP